MISIQGKNFNQQTSGPIIGLGSMNYQNEQSSDVLDFNWTQGYQHYQTPEDLISPADL